MAPSSREKVVDHMFICTHTVRRTSDVDSIILAANEGGLILDYYPNNQTVKIRILSRTTQTEMIVELQSLRIGARRKDGPLPVVYSGIESERVTEITRQAPGQSFLQANDLRKHAAGILTGIYEIRNRISGLNQHQLAWISDDIAISNAATLLNSGTMKCAPGLPALLCTNDWTLSDIIRVCPKIIGTYANRTAGIYMRIYYDFNDGEYFGCEPKIYIGQTVDMYERWKSHKYNMWNESAKEYSIGHYQIARQAKKVIIIQLCELDLRVGGTQNTGKALRDVCEQIFMLFFQSYRDDALIWHENAAQQTLHQTITQDINSRVLVSLYSNIARVALSKTGFALPDIAGRSTPFGSSGGLNKTSPLGGEGTQNFQRTTWALQELSDRFVFHRSQTHMADNKSLKSSGSFDIYAVGPVGRRRPCNGDIIYTSWEVMKAGDHPAQHFRVPDVGPWNIWNFTKRIAFKVTWRSTVDSIWRTKYIQRQDFGSGYMIQNVSTPGATWQFAHAAAMFGFLTRNVWVNKPDFIPWEGSIDLVKVSVDQFRQLIKVTVVTDPLVNVPAIEFSSEHVRQQMRDLGFENVDGRWRSLDFSFAADPQYYPNGIVPRGVLESTARRTRCDSCMVFNAGGRGRQLGECERVPGTNRCRPCYHMGRPCSWTKVPLLLGRHFKNINVNGAKIQADPVFVRNSKLLLMSPTNVEATTARVIKDPGYKRLEEDDGN